MRKRQDAHIRPGACDLRQSIAGRLPGPIVAEDDLEFVRVQRLPIERLDEVVEARSGIEDRNHDAHPDGSRIGQFHDLPRTPSRRVPAHPSTQPGPARRCAGVALGRWTCSAGHGAPRTGSIAACRILPQVVAPAVPGRTTPRRWRACCTISTPSSTPRHREPRSSPGVCGRCWPDRAPSPTSQASRQREPLS